MIHECAVTILFLGSVCSLHRPPVPMPQTVSGSPQARIPDQSPIDRCGMEGFSRSSVEHIAEEIYKPFVVRSVKGIIISQVGEWPEGIQVIFEIRLPDRSSQIRRAYTDRQGRFSIPNVPPGEYCFKATVTGWQSVVGTILVTAEAEAKSIIAFEMLLGV